MYTNKIISKNDSVTLTEQYVAMPDGVRLYTRYAVPNGAEKCPIVFIRSPYERAQNGVPINVDVYSRDQFIKRGFAVVFQHCRGKGDSEGFCIPYKNETRDGLATLDFIRSLPFYNGEIYVFGCSYLASVHWLYLSTHPHDVKGACLEIQTDRMFYQYHKNGCVRGLSGTEWWADMATRKYPHQNRDMFYSRPYISMATRVYGEDVPEIRDFLIHNTPDEYWTSDPRWNVIDKLDIPVLLIEGWYDFYTEGMFNMWERLPEDTKARSAMMVGPYGHARSVNEAAEYPHLENGNLPDGYAAEWFDSIHSGRAYGYAPTGKLTYYSTGAARWQSCIYPRERCDVKRLYLAPFGRLASEDTVGEALTYSYDPNSLKNPHKKDNIFRAFKVGEAEGVLSFISEPFEKDESFLGSVRFSLRVSTDCEDTGFFARIYLGEGEEFYNLTESVGAISYFAPDYKAGEVATIDIKSAPTAFTVKRGERIRIDVSSETTYLPHPNVKGHYAYVEETRVAKNTVFTEGSFIELTRE